MNRKNFTVRVEGSRNWSIETTNTAISFYVLLKNLDYDKGFARELFAGESKKHLHQTFLLWWMFSIEGFIQSLCSHTPCKHEKKSNTGFEGNLKEIYFNLFEKELDTSARPYQTVMNLYKFRCAVAHPKMKSIKNSSRHSFSAESGVAPLRDFKINSSDKIIDLLKSLPAERVYLDGRDVLIELYQACELTSQLPVCNGEILGMPKLKTKAI